MRSCRTAAQVNREGRAEVDSATPSPRPMTYRVLIETDEDGVFVATVPALPGCVADEPTRAEALARVREAIALYIESLEAHGDPIPPPITEELVEV